MEIWNFAMKVKMLGEFSSCLSSSSDMWIFCRGHPKKLQDSPALIRTCIFYELLRFTTKSVEYNYKNFTNILGFDVISYQLFDYWFYKFYNQLNNSEKLDLNIDDRYVCIQVF